MNQMTLSYVTISIRLCLILLDAMLIVAPYVNVGKVSMRKSGHATVAILPRPEESTGPWDAGAHDISHAR